MADKYPCLSPEGLEPSDNPKNPGKYGQDRWTSDINSDMYSGSVPGRSFLDNDADGKSDGAHDAGGLDDAATKL